MKNWIRKKFDRSTLGHRSTFGTSIYWIDRYVLWQIRYRHRKFDGDLYRFEDEVQSKGQPQVLDGHDRILEIRINHSNAGFFAYFIFALNQLLFCEKNNCLPVVHFGPWSGDGPNAYYDPKVGENVWDYYFEPPAQYTYRQIEEMIRDESNPLNHNYLYSLSDEDLWYLHKHNKSSIFGYPYGYYILKTRYDEKWYQRQRRRANRLINKYIRIKPGILQEVNDFQNEFMSGHHVIGIHMRGTDKGAASSASKTKRMIGPEMYAREIDKYSLHHPESKLFIATDQKQYLEYMKKRYGERVICYDSIRSSDKLAPFQMKDELNYKKGKDVLIDCLLLSRCDYLLKCTSHVGETALYFNPELKSIDLNYL